MWANLIWRTSCFGLQSLALVERRGKIKKHAKSFLGYFVVFMVAYTAFTLYRQVKAPPNPTWHMQALDGRRLDIDKMSQDAPVLVYFWGSWCHVCKTTSPKVNALAKSYPVVTIAVASGDDATLSDYLAQKSLDFTVVNDDSGEMFGAWQGQVTPSYVIVKDGRVTQSFVGMQPLWLLKTRMLF